MEENEQTYEEWLATRPARIQELAKKFPYGMKFAVNGMVYSLYGYAEDKIGKNDFVLLTEEDVFTEEGYERAVAGNNFRLCACCAEKCAICDCCGEPIYR